MGTSFLLYLSYNEQKPITLKLLYKFVIKILVGLNRSSDIRFLSTIK
jgi:hypothetical protein